MRTLTRRLLLLMPLVVLLLILAAYLLVDAWLESAGGRHAVESALARRLGMPVSLQGDFEVMLLPAIGVSGTDLVIGTPGADSELGRSGTYIVELALRPLLDREVVVETFVLSSGRFYLERLPEAGVKETRDSGEDTTSIGLALPEIRKLEIDRFEVYTGEGEPLELQAFEVDDFVSGADSPFELVVERYGAIAGLINWDVPGGRLTVDATWTGMLPGTAQLGIDARVDAASGSVRAGWSAEGRGPNEPDLELAFDYTLAPELLLLENVVLDAGDQRVGGAGCLHTEGPASLDLELETPLVDFDALPDLGALAGTFSEGGAPVADESKRFNVNLRLRAGEARFQGAVAHGAVFGMGAEPSCGGLSIAAPDDSPSH